MKDFLEETQIIDFKNEEVFGLAQELAKDCKSDEEIAKNCFLYVRDNIHHSPGFPRCRISNTRHLYRDNARSAQSTLGCLRLTQTAGM